MLFSVVSFFALVPLASGGQVPDDALLDAARSIDSLAKETGFSGAFLVARGQEVVFEAAYGKSDRAARKDNSLATQFRLGSMNKMFTAMAVLRLIDAGKLSLDDTVGRVLPEYRNMNVAEKVKVRHLLCHMGGTGDIFTDKYFENKDSIRAVSDYVDLFGDRDVQFEPGTKASYSNYGFVLLGRIIEKVSGEDYYEHLKRSLFAPLGMAATDSLPEIEKVAERAIGYLKNGADNAKSLPWRGSPAGGGYSTVRDLHKFSVALLEGKLLTTSLLVEATGKDQTSGKMGYGFGFGVRGVGKRRFFGHNGGAPGMNAEFKVYPETGVVFIALSNTDPPAASSLAREFEKAFSP